MCTRLSPLVLRVSLLALAWLFVPQLALADDEPPEAPAEPEASTLRVTPTGYIETYYAYNFNHPSNGITNLRGYDNRHNSFTIQNVALGASFAKGPVSGKLMLQVGSVGGTMYGSEPNLAGSSGASASNGGLWRYLQEAHIRYETPFGVQFTAGVIPSPIGMQAFAVKDQWTWSRSNLGFALPRYHAGAQATYALTDELSATFGIYNGWNSVVDDNEDQTLDGHITYRLPDRLTLQVLYFGGIERPLRAPEGEYWRHHFDVVAVVEPTRWLEAAVQADGGFEPNRFGTATWVAGALSVRAKPTRWLYFTVRGDRFHENVAIGNGGRSTPLFLQGIAWVSSGTATVELRPHDNVSFRIEGRHDTSARPIYFTKEVTGDGSAATPFLANASRQTTILAGATAWF